MTRSPTKLYSHHVANLRELQTALSNVARLARAAIALRDSQRSLRTLLRLYAFLLGAWAECKLRKLLHEEFGFSEAEREAILQEDSQIEQWRVTVDAAFRKHYKLPRAKLNARTLGVTASGRRDALLAILDQDLCIIIEIRNKLAHGQWIYPFNSKGTMVDAAKYQLINHENLLSLEFKLAMLGHLADAVHDLVVSHRTFDRDFDGHFRKLFQAKMNLTKRDYNKYALKLINSRQKACAKMTTSI